MTVESFLILLGIFATATSLWTECAKKILGNKDISYNLVSLIFGLIIGGCGSIIYYVLINVPLDVKNVIYAVLQGFATALCSQVGYDKVKQLILQMKV